MHSDILDIFWFGFPLREAKQSFDISISDATETTYKQLKHVLIEATERLLHGQSLAILPLSGGLDSRLILGCLLELLPAKNIYAFNYGLPGQLDFDISPLIAKAMGIHFHQVHLYEASLKPEQFHSKELTIEKTPAHNLIGYGVTKTVSELAIEKLKVHGACIDEKTAIWSGFLGDRIFAGKWAKEDSCLQSSCTSYVETYANSLRHKLVSEDYKPADRLIDLFEKYEGEKYSCWLELIDFEQRQYRVKRSLKTLNHPYRFLFEDKKVIEAFLTCTDVEREGGKLQRQFLTEHFPELSKLPVTSRLGYPLRKSEYIEKLDRMVRLFLRKIDNLAHTRFSRFQRRAITPLLLSKEISGYRETIDTGLEYAFSELKNRGFALTENICEEIVQSRIMSEQISSLGYLLNNSQT
jgi:asparagine synthetase B (glutamine-hydrolysing)